MEHPSHLNTITRHLELLLSWLGTGIPVTCEVHIGIIVEQRNKQNTMTFYDIIYGDPYSDNFCLDTVNDMFKNESDYSDSESSDYESCYFW